MPSDTILAIDQGTTSTRAIAFDGSLTPLNSAQTEFTQLFPKSGWVEHDPSEIWDTVISTCKQVLSEVGSAVGIGITNQRETTLVWDKVTGEPVYNAIVWQDRRTADYCDDLRDATSEMIVSKTGLLLDPYFSATKLRWILETVDGVRTRAEAGELLFGTVDTFLIWKLTEGRAHVTDATNASRTMMYNIHEGVWDEELLSLFSIPRSMLPKVLNSADDFGTTDLFGEPIPICGVAGDQQAATVGQACFESGMMKATYGTGCFAMLNTGDQPVRSTTKLLTTIAYQLNGKPTYVLEGSIFIAGAVVQWLRDGVQIIKQAADTAQLAETAKETENVIFVPAFTGLGAPYWNAQTRGAIFGLTRDTGRAEIARAALQSVAFQTQDLIEAIKVDWDLSDTVLRVDGGMANSDWTMQNLSDQLGAPVDRPKVTETTALGAAYLAGLHLGLFAEPAEFAKTWALEKRFEPTSDRAAPDAAYADWQDAVRRLLS